MANIEMIEESVDRRFQSADGGVERSLAGLGTALLRQWLEAVFSQLFELAAARERSSKCAARVWT